MKTHREIMETLSDLSASDRSWIIDRLSPAARNALLNGSRDIQTQETPLKGGGASSAAGNGSSAAVSAQPEKIPAALSGAQARQIATTLAAEPAWLIHALSRQSQAWRDEIRALLPETLRGEVENLERANVRYSPKMVELVEQKLATVLGETVVASERTGFDALVANVGAKFARKRLRIRR